jgi:hypothetical protein
MVVLMKEAVVMKDVVAASPVIAVSSMNFLGYTVADWAALLSIVWVLILMSLKVSDLWAGRKLRKKDK